METTMIHWAEFLPGFKKSNLHERSKVIVNLMNAKRHYDGMAAKCLSEARRHDERLTSELQDRYNVKELAAAHSKAVNKALEKNPPEVFTGFVN